MIPRGSGRRVALVTVVSGLVVVAATLLAYRSPAPAPGPANPATSTLTLALPGPFNGCSALSPRATATTTAILDLVRPSAFLTQPTDVLEGEGGAIVSAELTSLHPETVVYSVSPTMSWSDGHHFGVGDLIDGWRRARRLASISGDGYRAISSMTIGKDRRTLTAKFGSDFADWNLLFRDVEESGPTHPCGIVQLSRQPSLGPYRVQSATTTRIVLTSNPEWITNFSRFHTVVITSSTKLPRNGAAYFVKYAPVATQALIADLVAHPHYLGQLSNSSDIIEMTFSPHSALTSNRLVRTALSWLIDRRNIVSRLFGSLTFSPSIPTSALFSQGQYSYPPPLKGIVPSARDAPVVDPSRDCRACALQILRNVGYRRSPLGWRDAAGDTLRVKVAEGPTILDHVTTQMIEKQWKSLGISVKVTPVPSDAVAATVDSTGAVDAAIFERPTSTTPWTSARSWDLAPYFDSYPSGSLSTVIHKLFLQAQGSFNPATADLIWLKIDHEILKDFWVRPLYTVPSLTEWSNRVANVVPSLSLAGLVDQVTNWGIAPLTTTTTTRSSSSAR